MQLVILAGGRGTRLRKRFPDLPKCLIDIGGKPLIEHQILLAARQGIRNVLILTGYGAEAIQKHLGSGRRLGVDIRYRCESTPRGTAGAVLDAFDDLEEVFFVMYGDTVANVDLPRMAAAHRTEAAATLFLHPNDHPYDSDLVEMDEADEIVAFHPYPHPPDRYLANLVNAALYVVNKQGLRDWRTESGPDRHPLDFGKHLFPSLLANGTKLYGYRSREYIKDAGTPERLDQVRLDHASGRIKRGSLSTAVPAVFFDRDGTLNHERNWISKPDQLELLPEAAAAVRAVNESGRLAVVVSNQPVIARGECTEAGISEIHKKLEWLLGVSHAYVDAIYYCPHHPDKGFPGERRDLKIPCACRKPATGLLERAARDLNIDVSDSWLVGDSARDVQAAANFGIRSALVRTGPTHGAIPDDCKPPLVCDTVLDSVRHILATHRL